MKFDKRERERERVQYSEVGTDASTIRCADSPVSEVQQVAHFANSSEDGQDFQLPEQQSMRSGGEEEQLVATAKATTVREFKQAGYRLTPRRFRLIFMLAPCLIAMGAAVIADVREEGRHFNDVNEAIAKSSTEIVLHPKNWSNYYERSRLYLLDESYNQALADLDLAAAYCAGNTDAMAALHLRRRTILQLRRQNWWY